MNQEAILKAAAEAAMQQQGQGQQQQQLVPPQPVPMSIQMMTTQNPTGTDQLVVLVINHPLGQSVYHFTAEGAEQIAAGLTDTARLAKTGLQIAR